MIPFTVYMCVCLTNKKIDVRCSETQKKKKKKKTADIMNNKDNFLLCFFVFYCVQVWIGLPCWSRFKMCIKSKMGYTNNK